MRAKAVGQGLAATRRAACGLLAMAPLMPSMTIASTPLPRPSSGRVERLDGFPSQHVTARPVDVWLPAAYSEGRRHAVLYMHDGQMLFDASTTWNRQTWNVDAALSRLQRSCRVPATIVVGIHNVAAQRYAEFFPQKALALVADEAARSDYMQHAQNGKPLADAYLRFIVEELKPAIDRRYATLAGPEANFVMGSSMGGLISIYALCEYPQVFGGAAGLSTHWIGRPTAWGLERARNALLPLALLNYLRDRLPAPGRHRLYSDRGDDALEQLYAPAQAMLADLLRDRGWGPMQATTRVVEGSGHNERDWSARVESVLQFLLG